MFDFWIIVAAFFAAIIDTSLGMCYGTILAPALIICGYSPEIAVPAVLLSQLVVDVAGGISHAKVKNFTRKDVSAALLVAIPATLFVSLGAMLNIKLPAVLTKAYIGVLVLGLGMMMLKGIKFRKTAKGLAFISAIAGFNKGFMGGGFGPVVVSGQIIFNHDVRPSIAIGDIAEIPVCIVGLLVFAILGKLSFDPIFLIVCIPALIGSLIGPHLTLQLSKTVYSEKIIGSVILVLGAITILKLLHVI